MKYILFLVLIVFISCKDNCDIPAESFEQRFTVGKCLDMSTDSILRVDSIYKSFVSICDCKTYCEKTKEATNNSLIWLDSVINNTKDQFLKQQSINSKYYLLYYGPKCECQ